MGDSPQSTGVTTEPNVSTAPPTQPSCLGEATESGLSCLGVSDVTTQLPQGLALSLTNSTQVMKNHACSHLHIANRREWNHLAHPSRREEPSGAPAHSSGSVGLGTPWHPHHPPCSLLGGWNPGCDQWSNHSAEDSWKGPVPLGTSLDGSRPGMVWEGAEHIRLTLIN